MGDFKIVGVLFPKARPATRLSDGEAAEVRERVYEFFDALRAQAKVGL